MTDTTECKDRVVELTFSDVTVNPLVASRRGLRLKTGSKNTEIRNTFSTEVSAIDNEIVLPVIEHADPYTPPFALAHWGGAYYRNQTLVSSWKPQDSNPEYQHPNEEHYELGNDTIQLPNGQFIEDITVARDKPGSLESRVRSTRMQARIGLGRNSTLVNRLFDMRAILSRTWSLDIGWYGTGTMSGDFREDAGDWDDGNLILGGIDHGRYIGELYEQDFASLDVTVPEGVHAECHLQIDIVGVKFAVPGGGVTTLLDPEDGPMRACIDPLSPVITLNDDMIEKMAVLRRGEGSGFGLNNDPKDPYNAYPPLARLVDGLRVAYGWGRTINPETSEWTEGRLEFTFNNGFEIGVHNEFFKVPDWRITEDGRREVPYGIAMNRSDERIPDHRLLVTNLTDAINTRMPVLGAPFLSAVYLSVDNDAKKFYLGKSWRHQAHYDQSGAKEYYTENIPRVSQRASVPCPAATNSAESSTDKDVPTPGDASTGNDTGHNASPGLPVGAIAGAVIGGVTVLGLLIGLVWLWRHRRRGRALNSVDEVSTASGMPELGGKALKGAYLSWNELDAVQEVKEAGGNDIRAEADATHIAEAPNTETREIFEIAGDCVQDTSNNRSRPSYLGNI